MSLPESLNESKPVEYRTNEVSIQDIHRPVNHEHNEPHDGHEPVPTWAVIIFGVLLFWGGWYIANNSGNFEAGVYDEPSPKVKDSRASLVPSVLPSATTSATPIPTKE